MTDQNNQVQKTQKTQKINGVRGMNDLLPADAAQWAHLEHVLRDLTRAYGYEFLRTPIVEATAVFQRGIGEVTDIVEKEMYSFEDRLNGEQLTLRPEGTAALVRSVIENNLLYEGPKRLWYTGPMFRHERPQRGRYRQFHQFGIEALGFAGPDIDAEIILMGQRLWDELGLKGVRLEINSLGQGDERAAHRAALIKHLEQHKDVLDEDGLRRMYTNPLRVLDTKNPAMQAMADSAPKLFDFLGEASRAHFDGVCARLTDAGVPYRLNPRMVRGLDYYNLTVFEWVTDKLGAQATVCGGGRYDGLIELLGGKAAPAVGFAIGMERLLDLWGQYQPEVAVPECEVYVVHQGDEAQRRAALLAESLRDVGISVIVHAGTASFKSQFKRADASAAAIAVILAGDELAAGVASVKMLRAADQTPETAQLSVPLDDLVAFLKDKVN